MTAPTSPNSPTGPNAPTAPAQPGLTTGALARRLGVSPTTIRSWERRYGIGPAHHAPGRHRRWESHDVAVLEEMCRLTGRGVTPAEAARSALAASPDTPPAGVGAAPGSGGHTLAVGTVRPECRGLARASVRLDAPEVARILRRSVEDLGPVIAWTEVMTPALRAAGRKWAAEGERYVEVEHLLSWHVAAALRRAADQPDPARGPAALLAGMPTELHALPLEAVAAGLASRGLPFRMFGPALPPEALVEAVRRTGPPAVLLWSQVARTADRALAARVARITWGPHGAHTRPVVLAAGPGWSGSRWPPGALRPRDLATALDQLEDLLR